MNMIGMRWPCICKCSAIQKPSRSGMRISQINKLGCAESISGSSSLWPAAVSTLYPARRTIVETTSSTSSLSSHTTITVLSSGAFVGAGRTSSLTSVVDMRAAPRIVSFKHTTQAKGRAALWKDFSKKLSRDNLFIASLKKHVEREWYAAVFGKLRCRVCSCSCTTGNRLIDLNDQAFQIAPLIETRRDRMVVSSRTPLKQSAAAARVAKGRCDRALKIGFRDIAGTRARKKHAAGFQQAKHLCIQIAIAGERVHHRFTAA